LYKAIEGVEAEVWLVDNASSDDSIEYISSKFSWVKLIANKKNVGFAKANNQALFRCGSKYVLFLNPDTILPEDCLTKCLAFMEANEQAGAMGIRMIDGSGAFLPESKRSFPSALTSFYKLAGLSKLFPSSRTFSKYSLAYLDQHKNHEVDVLAGAFLLARRNILLELQGFDEAFFMYGEDIDLSYRIQKAGYKNYYFSESTIIHFKGESTRKGSLNYVKMFYEAMSIFVKKHYSGTSAQIFAFFIHIAIILRAGLSAALRFVSGIGIPVIDAILIYCAFLLANHFLVEIVPHGKDFTNSAFYISIAGFTLVFLATAAISGIYDNKYKRLNAAYCTLFSLFVILTVNSFLPKRLYFSVAVMLVGGIASLLFILFFRWLLHKCKVVDDEEEFKKPQQTIVVATEKEATGIRSLFAHAGIEERIIGRIAPDAQKQDAIGSPEELKAIVATLAAKEVIFCQGYLSNNTIIKLVQELPPNISIRFHAVGTNSIVGSDSKNTAGEFVSTQTHFQINEPYQRRMKRITDVSIATFLLITFPVHLVFIGINFFSQSVKVLIGKKTWISYAYHHKSLPALPKGVLTITGEPAANRLGLTKEAAQKLDFLYAKNYQWKHDLKLLFKSYKQLRGTP